MAETLAFPAVILVFLSGSTLLSSRSWRISIAALALQYLGITLLVSLSWLPPEAVVKLLAGWMAGAVLGLAVINLAPESEPAEPLTASFILFRAFLAVLAGMVAVSLAGALISWLAIIAQSQAAIEYSQAIGGLLLISLGLLHLGLTTRPLRVILGLLTVLGGFEIIYAALESSTLVAGLLAAITLGLAMVGAYLISAASLEGEEE